jgi:hypothetical protein
VAPIVALPAGPRSASRSASGRRIAWMGPPKSWIERISSGSEDFRSDAERLASYGISSTTALVEAVISLGLSRSPQMAANIDGMSRINDREVAAHGWLADPGGDATPLKLLVFVAGKLAATTETQGERPDVARELALAQGAEKNVSFQTKFGCSPGHQPVIVGLGPGKQYIRIKSPPCP